MTTSISDDEFFDSSTTSLTSLTSFASVLGLPLGFDEAEIVFFSSAGEAFVVLTGLVVLVGLGDF